jgi:putative redox protein
MTNDTLRSVTLRRAGAGTLIATNLRGGEITIGGGSTAFTPVELLLVAISGCSALDVDSLTSRRAEPETFEVEATAHKVRDEAGNRLEDIRVLFRVTFPPGDAGDAARGVLPQMVAKSHDRLCTVTRTVELGTPVDTRVDKLDGESG